MNATEIAAYRAENARLRAEEATRPGRDRALIVSHDKAVHAALAVLRDEDHGQALIEDRRRVASAQ